MLTNNKILLKSNTAFVSVLYILCYPNSAVLAVRNSYCVHLYSKKEGKQLVEKISQYIYMGLNCTSIGNSCIQTYYHQSSLL